jgi:hypothetical protein
VEFASVVSGSPGSSSCDLMYAVVCGGVVPWSCVSRLVLPLLGTTVGGEAEGTEEQRDVVVRGGGTGKDGELDAHHRIEVLLHFACAIVCARVEGHPIVSRCQRWRLVAETPVCIRHILEHQLPIVVLCVCVCVCVCKGVYVCVLTCASCIECSKRWENMRYTTENHARYQQKKIEPT